VLVFLDTNIFLYAAGRSHPEQEACGRILTLVAQGSLDSATNTEVVQEILYVLIRRGLRQEALALSGAIVTMFPDLFPVTRDDVSSARDLLKRYPGLPVRDAIHAASMIRNKVQTIVSVDSDFDVVSEIRRIEPRSLLR
jgi:predicted nucleic acid-binding protein